MQSKICLVIQPQDNKYFYGLIGFPSEPISGQKRFPIYQKEVMCGGALLVWNEPRPLTPKRSVSNAGIVLPAKGTWCSMAEDKKPEVLVASLERIKGFSVRVLKVEDFTDQDRLDVLCWDFMLGN